MSMLVFPIWKPARMISVTLFQLFLLWRSGTYSNKLGGMGKSVLVTAHVRSFGLHQLLLWIPQEMKGWTIKIHLIWDQWVFLWDSRDLGATNEVQQPVKEVERPEGCRTGETGGKGTKQEWEEVQNYRRAEGKERQRTAFILLVSAGWENSSLDMCVSGDAVRSPGETDEGSLGSISRRVSASLPHLSERWSSRNSNSLIASSFLGFSIDLWSGERKEGKNILQPKNAGARLPEHRVRCLASKLPNGSQTKSVCPRSGARGPPTHLNGAPLINIYIGCWGGR